MPPAETVVVVVEVSLSPPPPQAARPAVDSKVTKANANGADGWRGVTERNLFMETGVGVVGELSQ